MFQSASYAGCHHCLTLQSTGLWLFVGRHSLHLHSRRFPCESHELCRPAGRTRHICLRLRPWSRRQPE